MEPLMLGPDQGNTRASAGMNHGIKMFKVFIVMNIPSQKLLNPSFQGWG